MTGAGRLLIRNAEVEGRVLDIAIEGGRIAALGAGLAGEELIDARGGAAIPGLHDHHIHLLATAAARDSVRLDDCADGAAVAARLRAADAASAPGAWLRATGYHERIGGPLDAHALDAIVPARPVRVQHQTGALWMLNGAAMAAAGWPKDRPRDGRLFREDGWLAARIGRTLPDLAALGRDLAAFGITGVTDASVTTDAAGAALLGAAGLPLRLTLMSGGALPAGDGYRVGPVKIVLDDDRLPPVDDLVEAIRAARAQRRKVAAHCVTAGELAVMLAAFEAAGSEAGDRIEHGSIVPPEAIPVLRALRLTVVTQPGLVATRGDRYRATVDPAERNDLYRCASLIAGGVPVGGSSDAPYGDPDPWAAIRAATTRRTALGAALGEEEQIAPARALALYLSPAGAPGDPPRRIVPGEPADLCILRAPLRDVLGQPDADQVAATVMGGAATYRRDRA